MPSVHLRYLKVHTRARSVVHLESIPLAPTSPKTPFSPITSFPSERGTEKPIDTITITTIRCEMERRNIFGTNERTKSKVYEENYEREFG